MVTNYFANSIRTSTQPTFLFKKLTTLATLWQVNDESTAALMKSFYQHLNSDRTKAEALRLAQLELWQRSDKDWQVPAFWSAYIAIGNWK